MRFFLFCTLLWMGACSAPDKAEVKVPVAKKEVAQVPVKKRVKKQATKSGYINNGNLVKVLTDFAAKNKEDVVYIKTKFGRMKVLLYKDVPLHSANFLMLAKDGYFDGTVFYRVVPGLVIQGGDTDDRKKSAWKRKIGSYTLPSEFRSKYVHKKGALAMSRLYEKNPEKRSSSWDFYIVHGDVVSEGMLRTIPEEHRAVYRERGGTPHLDGEHTVFGEVVEGMDVIDKIVMQRRDRGDWPITDVTIEMEVED